MAVTYGFFNSVNGDRKYDADQMSEFYNGIVTEGVFQHVENGLEVTAGTGMTVAVATGRAIIQNKWVKNDAVLTLDVGAASDVSERVDAVVIRFNSANRNVSIVVKQGGADAPSMTRSGGIYEMALAYINIQPGATTVSVVDKRSDTSVCGWAAVAQATSGEVDQMLDDMKIGFDGVTYSSPAAMIQACDNLLQEHIDNIGVNNIIPSAFGYDVSINTLPNYASNPALAAFHLKKSITTTDNVKLKITYNLKAIDTWCYFRAYFNRQNPIAYQDILIDVLDGNTPKNQEITKEITFTPSGTFTDVTIYYNNTSLAINMDVPLVELYANGEYIDVEPDTDTSSIPEYSQININPKGSLATLEYAKNNFAKGVSSLNTGKWLLPNYYTVCPDLDSNNMYGMKLYTDYMTYDAKTVFDNRKDHMAIYPPLSQSTNVATKTKTLKFIQDNTEKAADQTINIISTKESVTDKKLRILTIGDSVTEGYGAEGQQYWKTLYKHLRINSILKESGYVPIMLGTKTESYTFEYDEEEYTDLLGCEGYSGMSLLDIYNNPSNIFYDPNAAGNCKFSINAWLSKYRTMDDNGNRLTIDSPYKGTLVTAENINTMNVCKPNVVIINLGHNDFYTQYTENMQLYFDYYDDIIGVIRSELPDAYIIPCVTMPLVGCFHPDLYPNYGIEIDINTAPYNPWYVVRYQANVEHWKTFIAGNTDTKILVMPEWNITPTKDAFKWVKTSNESEDYYYSLNEFGNAHPYKPAHDVYGYELYAMCQYIKTLMS